MASSSKQLMRDAQVYASRIENCQFGLARMREINPIGYAADIQRVEAALAHAEASLARYMAVMSERLVREADLYVNGTGQ